MNTTIQQLTKRIDNLELLVYQPEDNKDKEPNQSLISQIDSLKLKLFKIYQSHPEFEKLSDLNTKLKTWNKPSRTTTTTITNEFKQEEISDEVKLETINLHCQDILDTYPQIIEILSIQYDSIIKGINQLIIDTDIINNTTLLSSKKEQLNHVYKIYQTLNVKSMMVVEKYVELSIKSNKFWIGVEKQIQELNRKINKIEQVKKELNKY